MANSICITLNDFELQILKDYSELLTTGYVSPSDIAKKLAIIIVNDFRIRMWNKALMPKQGKVKVRIPIREVYALAQLYMNDKNMVASYNKVIILKVVEPVLKGI